MPKYAIIGAAIITPASKILPEHAVLVADGTILDVVPASEVPLDVPIKALNGGYLAPGFVDIHVHGAHGRSFSSSAPEDIRYAAQFLLSKGVTTVVPTLISSSVQDISSSLKLFDSLQDSSELPLLPGVHLEGPHFSPGQAGAQQIDILRAPNPRDTALLLEHHSAITMVSLAPELQGAVALTQRLSEAGIVVAAGHSDATEQQLLECMAAGLSHVIHLYSAQSTIRREGPWRVPGLLEATLASDTLTVEVIADGRHLPDSLLKIADRCLRGRLCAVSDGTPGTGLPANSRYQMGDGHYEVSDGVGMTLDGLSFGGSTTVLSDMLTVLDRALDISLPELIAMFTTIPARAAKLYNVGQIASGFRADFVHLDGSLNVKETATQGRWLTS